MAYSPYQTAGSQATLYDLFQQSKFGEQKASSSTTKQRSKLTEEFEAELEAAQKAAEKKANKHGKFFKGLNILGSFLGPLGAGLTKGISALGQGQQQKKGLEQLLKGVDMKRWGKTFLKDPSKSYKEEAEGMQMSSGDVLRGGIGAGISGYGTSAMMGGKRNEGLGQKMFEKGEGYVPETASSVGVKAPDLLGDATSEYLPKTSATEMWQGAGELGESSFGIGGARVQAPDLLSGNNIQGLVKSLGIRPDLISRPIGQMVEGAGKATPFKNLFGELTNFTEGKGAMDKAQQSMMLPMLLQQLFGGEY